MMEDNILSAETIKQFKLPPTPYTLNEIQKEIKKDDFEIGKIANLIAQDAALSALILRSVNSSFFSLRQEVSSIHQAINLLGVKNTINIVSALILRQGMTDDGLPMPPRFWDSPTNVALISAALTKQLTRLATDEAYMLGLFHNVGHVLMMSKFDGYGAFLEHNFNPYDDCLIALEIEQFAIEHASLGYVLAKTWGLSDYVCQIIRYHHRVIEVFEKELLTDDKDLTMLCMLKMAENIDKYFWGIRDDTEWAEIEGVVLDYMGMSELDYKELAEDMSEKLISGS